MSSRRGDDRLVAPALVVAVLAISFAAPFFKKAAPTDPLVSAATRLAVACLLLLPFAARSWRRNPLGKRQLRLAALAGVFYGIHFGSWVSSLSLTTVAASVTLVTSTPLLLAVVAVVTGRDRPDRRHWLAIGLAALGVVTIAGTDWRLSADALAGDGLALLGACAMAGYLLIGRRMGSRFNLWVFSTIATGVGAAALAIAAFVAGVPLRTASLEAFGYLALAAIVPQLIGHNLLTWALRHTRPTIVGLSTVGEPVGATVLAWLWLGDGVPLPVAVGCLVTMSAVILAIANPASDN